MSQRSNAGLAGPTATTRIAGALVLVAAMAAASSASASGPWVGMDGAWSGNGSVLSADGTKDRIRCRASYLVQDDGNNLQQSLRCASDSYKFEVTSYVKHSAGSISGIWTETVQKTTGKLSGSADAKKIDGQIAGTGFTATMVVLTQGNSQTLTIRPTGTSVKEVAINLKRGAAR